MELIYDHLLDGAINYVDLLLLLSKKRWGDRILWSTQCTWKSLPYLIFIILQLDANFISEY